MAAVPAIPIRAGQRGQNKPVRPPHRRAWSAKEGDGRLLRISSDPDRETVTDPDPDLDLDPASGTRSESESELESEPYSDPDTDPDVGLDSDSEGELLRKRIAYHKGWDGPNQDEAIGQRDSLEESFCRKIKADPDKTLSKCEAETIKAYLEERVTKFRIKKESSIKAYWKRLSCAYIDLAGHRMDNGTELDIRDWIPTYLTPTYKLDTSEKDKLAMYVQDLYAVIQAHWVEDTKALHGRLRVEISLLLLLSAATTTRPGALVESGSAKGSNKALSYEHVSIMKVRDVKDPDRTTTVVMVNLVHIKNSGGKGRRKKFIFRLESTPAFCILSHILSIALADDAFRLNYTSVEEIFSLEIPPQRDMLRLRFKREKEKQPIFRNVERTPDGTRVSNSKALPYHKYRDHFVYLGRFAGVLTPEERNQTMGHHGSTYEQFYMPDLIERDFQSIYFGTQSQDALIRSAARMGLSRDKRAPRELTDEQKLEVNSDPELVRLRKKRERCKEKIRDRGYYSIEAAKGTHLHTRYEEIKRKINNMTNTLRRKRLDQAILDFHDSIDTIEIDRQLNGIGAPDTLPQTVEQYELRERAAVARLLCQPLDGLDEAHAMKLRSVFIRNLSSLCHRQESQRCKASDGKISFRFEDGRAEKAEGTVGIKRGLSDSGNAGARKRQRPLKEESNSTSGAREPQEKPRIIRPIKDEDIEIIQSPYPMVFTGPVCLICIGDEQLSKDRQTRPFARKYTLQKHLKVHVQEGRFEREFKSEPGWDL
ncbi:hypothetical protein H2199_005755 [Coniosporium tulheliwenetii]|uniref:Uncharacterized protein n=1 Tax=Coniosporium tulheliwenetii TaxID=3383036 RepID=A0ACC2Z056_9PEZI|nr:hypothetical protein H2199_005755 [Cladosporium sp. JES 115]